MHFYNFSKKHSQRISAFMMASKMLSIIVLLSFVPIDSVKLNTKAKAKADMAIRLDQTSSNVLVGKERKVEVFSGQSTIDAQNNRQVAYAGDVSGSVERDPSYFRGLYLRAGAAYGVPWQLIEAVHYVETGCSDSTNETSYAGATGPMQFMPGTWRTYAADGDGDGQANINDVEDAVFGAANLLASSGAAEGNIDAALFNYNHAQWYVDKVKNIAQDAGM